MRTIIVAALILLLTACGTTRERIVIQEVKVSVPVPCDPTLPQRPALMTKEKVRAAMAAALNLDDRIKIVTEQLLLHIGWVPVIEGGLRGCKG